MQISDIFGEFPILETERTRLRKVTQDDVEDMFRYCSDEAVARYTTWHPHRTKDDTKAFIAHLQRKYESGDIAPWGIEDKLTSAFIGTCGFMDWNTAHARAELGYALSRDYWGKGVMTEIAGRIIEFGFKEMGLVRIEARCLAPNVGSAKVMEKTGMSYEGTMRKVVLHKGVYEDLLLYAIVRDDI